jgi:S-formylglutathione hydrolase FrmB
MIIIGALTDRMAVVLWILAILTNWTAVQRTWYTHKEAGRLERQEYAAEQTPNDDPIDRKVSAKAGLQT